MSEKRKPQRSPTTELINVRFFENQKRQALTTELPTNEGEDADENYSSSVTTTIPCDTPETNPPPPPIVPTGPGSFSAPEQSGGGHEIGTSSTTPPSSSLAISAPSDKSRKGSVDQKIWNLVNLINGESNSFFTTSSCSGRIILYTWDTGSDNSSADQSKLKKGCKWLLVSHDEVQPDELVNAYRSYCETEDSANLGDEVYFKMEPCILHVQCRTLSNARKLIHLATESGFRNSGMVIGKENRITVAIRSAMGLEVPLPCSIRKTEKSSNLISKEYLNYLAAIGNTKLIENWARNEKLVALFSATVWKE